MQSDDGTVPPGPMRPVVAPARAPVPVTVVAVLERPVTDDDLVAAAAAGLDAVTDGEAPFAADPTTVDPTTVSVAAPATPAALGTVCAALHRGVRVVVCVAAAPADCAGTVRAVRTYGALLDTASSADASPREAVAEAP